MKYLLILLIVLTGCQYANFSLHTEDITNMYVDYIEEWKIESSESFNKAEQEVYKTAPIDDIITPNEDPNKCPCKGSGVIVHGDGHETVCPFHGQSQDKMDISSNKDVTIKHFRR